MLLNQVLEPKQLQFLLWDEWNGVGILEGQKSAELDVSVLTAREKL